MMPIIINFACHVFLPCPPTDRNECGNRIFPTATGGLGEKIERPFSVDFVSIRLTERPFSVDFVSIRLTVKPNMTDLSYIGIMDIKTSTSGLLAHAHCLRLK